MSVKILLFNNKQVQVLCLYYVCLLYINERIHIKISRAFLLIYPKLRPKFWFHFNSSLISFAQSVPSLTRVTHGMGYFDIRTWQKIKIKNKNKCFTFPLTSYFSCIHSMHFPLPKAYCLPVNIRPYLIKIFLVHPWILQSDFGCYH